jgi:hypothetical protein
MFAFDTHCGPQECGQFTHGECRYLSAENAWRVKFFVYEVQDLSRAGNFSNAGAVGRVRKFQPAAVGWRVGDRCVSKRVCPTGKSTFVNPKKIAFVQPCREKYSASEFHKIMVLSRRPASMKRGVWPIVTMTWSAGCDGRERLVRRARRERTAKACGPGALVAGAKLAEMICK